MQEFECAAVLFDLDGVLVDSTRSVARQWRMWGAENNLDPDKVVDTAHGRRTLETVRLLAPHLDAEAETRRIEEREASDTDGVTVMPGASALLSSIADGRWCVVTSGTRYLATSRLRVGKLPTPAVLISADDVSQGKPHPEPYLMGARRLGVNPAECVVVEDAPAGLQAAHAAGMRVIGMTSTYSAKELAAADVVIRELAQLRVNSDGDLRLRITIVP
jgi:mannitol-1-/sugar-/sorbitol-6-phosphatase